MLAGLFPQVLYLLILREPLAQMPHGVTGAEHPKMCKRGEEQVDTRLLYI